VQFTVWTFVVYVASILAVVVVWPLVTNTRQLARDLMWAWGVEIRFPMIAVFLWIGGALIGLIALAYGFLMYQAPGPNSQGYGLSPSLMLPGYVAGVILWGFVLVKYIGVPATRVIVRVWSGEQPGGAYYAFSRRLKTWFYIPPTKRVLMARHGLLGPARSREVWLYSPEPPPLRVTRKTRVFYRSPTRLNRLHARVKSLLPTVHFRRQSSVAAATGFAFLPRFERTPYVPPEPRRCKDVTYTDPLMTLPAADFSGFRGWSSELSYTMFDIWEEKVLMRELNKKKVVQQVIKASVIITIFLVMGGTAFLIPSLIKGQGPRPAP